MGSLWSQSINESPPLMEELEEVSGQAAISQRGVESYMKNALVSLQATTRKDKMYTGYLPCVSKNPAENEYVIPCMNGYWVEFVFVGVEPSDMEDMTFTIEGVTTNGKKISTDFVSENAVNSDKEIPSDTIRFRFCPEFNVSQGTLTLTSQTLVKEIWIKHILFGANPQGRSTSYKTFQRFQTRGEEEVHLPESLDVLSEIWIMSHQPLSRLHRQLNKNYTNQPLSLYRINTVVDTVHFGLPQIYKYMYRVIMDIKCSEVQTLSFLTTVHAPESSLMTDHPPHSAVWYCVGQQYTE